MMSMMAGGMIWMSVLSAFTLGGFAYIIWILAAKEAGTIKLVGQVIAAVIGILALIILLYGGIYGGMLGRGGCGGIKQGMEMNQKMMKGMDSKKMKQMQKMMNEYMK